LRVLGDIISAIVKANINVKNKKMNIDRGGAFLFRNKINRNGRRTEYQAHFVVANDVE